MKVAWYGKTSGALHRLSGLVSISWASLLRTRFCLRVLRPGYVSLDVDGACPLCSSYTVWFSNMTRPPHSSRGMFCCWLRWLRALTLWRCEGSNVSFSSKRLMAKEGCNVSDERRAHEQEPGVCRGLY